MTLLAWLYFIIAVILAVYPVAMGPAWSLLGLGVAAMVVAAAGRLSRRYGLFILSAGVLLLEYFAGLPSRARMPGPVEPVAVGLGVLAFLEISYAHLLCLPPREPASMRLVSDGEELFDGEETPGARGHSGILYIKGIAPRLLAVAVVSALLAGVFLVFARGGARIRPSLVYPALVVAASVLGLSVYWLIHAAYLQTKHESTRRD